MRKGLLGTIAAVTAGAGAASGQFDPSAPGQMPPGMMPPGMMPPGMVAPATGYGPPIPAQFGGSDPGAGLLPVQGYEPNGAPIYPPPGAYGAPAGEFGSASANNRNIAPHWWLNSEYLVWFVRAQPTSNGPYLTTGARADGGLLGRNTTVPIAGGGDLGYGTTSGFRVTGGWFKGDDRRLGVEFSGFLLEQKGNNYYAQSDRNGVPVISRPFIDATNGTPGVLVVAFPNLATGSALVESTTQTWGGEINSLCNLFRSCPDAACPGSISFMAGFRYMEINEMLAISSSSTLLGSATTTFAGLTANAPATVSVFDKYETTNRFYGGQIGLKSDVRVKRWTVSSYAKIAAGLMNQTLDVSGSSDINDPTRNISATSQGGLYANAATVGRFRHDEFSVIPELSVNLAYNWTSGISTFVGYSGLYASRVIRPGSQFTNLVNPGLVPTSPSFGTGGIAATPNNVFTQEEFWLQGVSFGVNFKY